MKTVIGFASGIYFSKFHQTILKFASENLPENKEAAVSFVAGLQ